MFKRVIIVIFLCINSIGLSQITSVFDFSICKPVVCDTIVKESNGDYRIQFYSQDSSARIQQQYENTILVRSDVFFLKANPFQGNVFEYFPNGKIKNISSTVGDTLISQEFYESGARKKYCFGIIDPSSVCFFGKSSYCIHYYQNGTIKMEFNFLDLIKDFNEYWDNGMIKKHGNYIPCLNSYTGAYKEYSSQGELLCKGEYFSNPTNQLKDKSIKIGKWKYYENGKLQILEVYDKEGNLMYKR